MNNSFSESYKAAGVDITAGYKAVELMKAVLPEPPHPKAHRISEVSEDSLFQIWQE